MRLHLLGLVLVLSTLVPAAFADEAPAAPSVTPAAPSPVAALEGRYVLADPAAARRDVRAAVTTASASVTPSMRSVLEAGLASMLAVPRAIAVRAMPDRIDVTRDAVTLGAPADGREHAQAGDAGRTVRVVHRWDGRVFVEEQRTRSGVRTDRFERVGDALRVHSELRASMLRAPIALDFVYRVDHPAPTSPPTDDSDPSAR